MEQSELTDVAREDSDGVRIQIASVEITHRRPAQLIEVATPLTLPAAIVIAETAKDGEEAPTL